MKRRTFLGVVAGAAAVGGLGVVPTPKNPVGVPYLHAVDMDYPDWMRALQSCGYKRDSWAVTDGVEYGCIWCEDSDAAWAVKHKMDMYGTGQRMPKGIAYYLKEPA